MPRKRSMNLGTWRPRAWQSSPPQPLAHTCMCTTHTPHTHKGKTYLAGLNDGHILCAHFPLHAGGHADPTTAPTQHQHLIVALGCEAGPCVQLQGAGLLRAQPEEAGKEPGTGARHHRGQRGHLQAGSGYKGTDKTPNKERATVGAKHFLLGRKGRLASGRLQLVPTISRPPFHLAMIKRASWECSTDG